MWLGDVLQSKVMVKHSAAILLYGFVSGSGNSTRGTWSELLEVRLGNICKGGRVSDSEIEIKGEGIRLIIKHFKNNMT